MHQDEFEKLIEKGYGQLPQWKRDKIKNVALLVEDEPSEETRAREGLGDDETLLGYYHGVPLSARGEGYGVGMTLPDTITLYQLPIEDEAMIIAEEENISFENAAAKVVAETIWHEFAHYFGMDEHEVRERESKRNDIVS